MRKVYRDSLPEPIKRSLSASWKEGVVAQVMISIFDYYLTPYALVLGATNPQVGLLTAIPNFMSSFSQFFAVRAVDVTGSRRGVLIWGIGIQAVLLVPVVLLSVVPVPGKVAILIVLIVIFRVLGSIIGPAWGSLVSNYLPEGQRGQYFGWRQRMVSIAGIVGVSFWGGLLSIIKQFAPAAGFVVLFGAAVLFRCMSFFLTTKMVDVPVEPTPGADFTFWQFIRRFRESNFVRFIFYTSAVTFASQLCAPLFAVQMLKNLHFSYLAYTAVNLSAVVVSLITFPLWGRHCDVVGNAKVIKSCGFLITFIPFFWIFAREPYQITLIEMFSGFAFSGFSLASQNYIFDAVTPAKRVRCLSYNNIINGAAIFAGASLGGWLADKLPPINGYSICTLFLLSGLVRFPIDLLARGFKEVRPVTRKISYSQLYMSVLGLKPMVMGDVETEPLPEIRPPREKLQHESS